MGPIKHELQVKNARQSGAEFCIQFTIGARTICSEKFKLVSSCSQLPEELKNIVRPSKKGRPSNLLEQRTTSPPTPSSSDISTPKSDTPNECNSVPMLYNLQNLALSQIATLRKELDHFILSGDVENAMETAKLLAQLHKQSNS